jgi:hypothetical protein
MNDEYEGQGGSYVIDPSGARKLVERTRDPRDDAPPEPPETPDPAALAANDKPAKAGFLLPAAPAKPTTDTE